MGFELLRQCRDAADDRPDDSQWPTVLLTEEPLWAPLDPPDATDLSEEYSGYERGIRGGELQEVVSGGGGRLEENVTYYSRGIPLAVDLDEHAGETVERGIHAHGRDKQLLRQALELHLPAGITRKERLIPTPFLLRRLGIRGGHSSSESTPSPYGL